MRAGDILLMDRMSLVFQVIGELFKTDEAEARRRSGNHDVPLLDASLHFLIEKCFELGIRG